MINLRSGDRRLNPLHLSQAHRPKDGRDDLFRHNSSSWYLLSKHIRNNLAMHLLNTILAIDLDEIVVAVTAIMIYRR